MTNSDIPVPLSRRVEQLATRYYLFRLMFRAGVDSAYALEELLATQEERKRLRWYEQRSRRINKNLNGTVLKDRRLIDRAESEFAGSQKYLEEVLWDVLKNPESNKDELNRLFFRLSPQLVSRYTSTDPATGQLVRKPIRQSIQIKRLEYQGTLPALACLLIFSRELELDGNPMLHIDAQWAAHGLAIRLCSFEPLPKIFGELYDLLFETYLGKYPHRLQAILPSMQPPKPSMPVMSMLEMNQSILRAAKAIGMIAEDRDKEMQFLFWVGQGPKAEIHQALLQEAEKPSGSSNTRSRVLLRLEEVIARGFRYNDYTWH